MRIEIEVGGLVHQLDTFDEWAHIGQCSYRVAIQSGSHLIAIDALGRVCCTMRDFVRARDEGAFPVSVYRA